MRTRREVELKIAEIQEKLPDIRKRFRKMELLESSIVIIPFGLKSLTLFVAFILAVKNLYYLAFILFLSIFGSFVLACIAYSIIKNLYTFPAGKRVEQLESSLKVMNKILNGMEDPEFEEKLTGKLDYMLSHKNKVDKERRKFFLQRISNRIFSYKELFRNNESLIEYDARRDVYTWLTRLT